MGCRTVHSNHPDAASDESDARYTHLGQHGLVAAVRVDVDRAQEAGLAWVRVDPPQYDEAMGLAVEEELLLVRGAHRVARALLLGDDERREAHLRVYM